MSDFQEIIKEAHNIRKYAELMNDEYGEALLVLCDLHWRSEYLGEELQEVLSSKILEQSQFLKINASIVETDEVVTQKRTIKEIEWLNGY